MAREYYQSNISKEFYKRAVASIEGKLVIVYDLETTGLSPDSDRWIQLSARKCQVNGGRLDEIDKKVWFAKPPMPLPAKIVELTGITDDFLADKPRDTEVFHEVSEYFGSEVVMGYNNNRFDDKFMENYYQRCGGKWNPPAALDCFTFVKAVVRPDETENKKLETITRYFNLEDEVSQFHNAEGDTAATKLVFNELMERAESADAPIDNLIKCNVMRIADWKGHQWGQRSIYVETNRMTLVFNCKARGWYLKDENDRIQRYDVDDVVKQVFELTKCGSEDELASWKGKIYA